MTEKIVVSLTDVSETLLIPLCARAVESYRADAMILDGKAISIVFRAQAVNFRAIASEKNFTT